MSYECNILITKTGKIRQLLCHYCNCGLDSFNDSIEF